MYGKVSYKENGVSVALEVTNYIGTSTTEKVNLTINKTNTSGKSLNGVKFKIQVRTRDNVEVGWLIDQKSSYEYTSDYGSATTFSTSSGTIKIEGLNASYIYRIYETKGLTGYASLDMQRYYGMTTKVRYKDSKGDWRNAPDGDPQYDKQLDAIWCTSVSRLTHGREIEVNITNAQVQNLQITGSVWEELYDPTATKQGDSQDNLKDDWDDGIKGVKVSLCDSNDKAVNIINKKGRTVKEVSTDSNGTYIFGIENKRPSDMDNYHIKFNYTGYVNEKKEEARNDPKNPREIEYYVMEKKISLENGSKAESDGTIYPISDEKNYFDTSFYDKSTTTLKYMNLGLAYIEINPEMKIEQNIDYVTVKMNDYTYVYDYDGEKSQGAEVFIDGKNGGSIKAYVRQIYPSDIAYSQALGWGEDTLEVYVTYKIIISNPVNTTYKNVDNIKSAYKKNASGSNSHHASCKESEKVKTTDYSEYSYRTRCYTKDQSSWTSTTWAEEKLVLGDKNKSQETLITNTFDTYKYKLADASKWKENKNWDDKDDDGIAKYIGDKIELYQEDDNKHKGKSSKELEMTLRVNNNYLQELLGGTNNGVVEPTKVKAKGIHIGYSYGQLSCTKTWTTYDSEGKPHPKSNTSYYLNIVNANRNTENSDSAYGLQLKLDKERTISGVVFRDNDADNTGEENEVLGDGKYQSGENVVENVTVELVDEEGNLANVYPDGNRDGIDATFKSNNQGQYTIKGVPTGKYYVRFTYGDGNQKIVGANENVSLSKYKSTIITDEYAKAEFKKNRDSSKNIKNDNSNWYRKLTGTPSVAHDDLETRKNFNHKDATSRPPTMPAYTPYMNIKIENDDEGRHTVEDDEDSGWSSTKNGSEKSIENINFGIINIPKIELGFEKNITNIKVINAQGNVLINGNPNPDGGKQLKYVSNLSNKKEHLTKGSDYVKVEIADNEIYGAQLEITYTLTVINNSEINYYEEKKSNGSESNYYGDYYIFGEKANSEEESISVDTIMDYLDEKLTMEKKEPSGATYKYTLKMDSNNVVTIDGGSNPKYLFSEKKHEEDESRLRVELIATEVLSNTDDDKNFVNWAKVEKISITDDPSLIEDPDKHEVTKDDPNPSHPKVKIHYNNYITYQIDEEPFDNPSEDNELIIVPPTGIGKIIMYLCIIMASGGLIAGGIILIKKKVL